MFRVFLFVQIVVFCSVQYKCFLTSFMYYYFRRKKEKNIKIIKQKNTKEKLKLFNKGNIKIVY